MSKIRNIDEVFHGYAISVGEDFRMERLQEFLTESNKIERKPPPTGTELYSAMYFLDRPTLLNLSDYVKKTSDAELRNKTGMNVRVGSHIAPKGGPWIFHSAKSLVDIAKDNLTPESAYRNHREYEHLHPFMDGNGRSGRLLWYLQMREKAPIGFLQQWYYQSLEFGRH